MSFWKTLRTTLLHMDIQLPSIDLLPFFWSYLAQNFYQQKDFLTFWTMSDTWKLIWHVDSIEARNCTNYILNVQKATLSTLFKTTPNCISDWRSMSFAAPESRTNTWCFKVVTRDTRLEKPSPARPLLISVWCTCIQSNSLPRMSENLNFMNFLKMASVSVLKTKATINMEVTWKQQMNNII